MLTGELCRAIVRRGAVHPRYIDPSNDHLLRIAHDLISVYAEHVDADGKVQGVGPRRGELEEEIAGVVQEQTDPLLFRGLVKLLDDRCEVQMTSPLPPEALREALFRAAALVPNRRAPGLRWSQKRRDILRQVAEDLSLSPDQVEEGLFADLEENQRLLSFKLLTAPELLNRYNVGLAQAVLLRAVSLELEIFGSDVGACRQLFRDLKFFQLIHHIDLEGPEGGVRITVDGPLSLFNHSKRYGLAMAQLLPTLLLLPQWRLDAQLLWGTDRRPLTFHLDPKRGLISHRKARGQYVADEQIWLEERFKKSPGDWEMERSTHILRTREGEVVIPDLVFTNRQDGRRGYVEIIGFWRRGSLERRLSSLGDPSLAGLFLAVSRNLGGERKADPQDHPRILWFKNVVSASALKAALDAHAIPSPEGK